MKAYCDSSTKWPGCIASLPSECHLSSERPTLGRFSLTVNLTLQSRAVQQEVHPFARDASFTIHNYNYFAVTSAKS